MRSIVLYAVCVLVISKMARSRRIRRMRKSLTIVIAALANAMLFSISTANATVYRFGFDSGDAELTATGQMTVNAAGEVTGISGLISGLVDQTISAVIPNPNSPGPGDSPDGTFSYDNLYHASGMPFDSNGLLFVTAQNPIGYWNLWANSSGKYSLWESAGDNYPIAESGNLSLTAVPEISTWAMKLHGFAGLAVAGYRRAEAGHRQSSATMASG